LGGLLALNMLSFSLLISFGENCKKNENKTLITAQGAINVWLRQHNQIRPHHASGMTPPAPETLLEKTKLNGRI
jgi:hypothetical protein